MNLFSLLSDFVFCSINSGSNGNCYFIGAGDCGILVDVGISVRTIKSRLKAIGYDLQCVKAVLLTHSHIDHVKGVPQLIKYCKVPVYASESCFSMLKECNMTMDSDLCKVVTPVINIDCFRIEPFYTEHDAPGSLGFFVSNGDKSIVIATDVGTLTPAVKSFLKKADNVVIETNYDKEMLLNGKYPDMLKSRIMGVHGHLGNEETCAFIIENYKRRWDNVFFCHLSENNNSPDKVMSCFHHCLNEKNIHDFGNTVVHLLSRYEASPLFYL